MTKNERRQAVIFLEQQFNPTPQHCQTWEQDLQLAITLNPSLDKIIAAMYYFADWYIQQPDSGNIGREEYAPFLKD